MAEATSSPTVWRRWLALELRRLRNEAGLGQKEAGKRCGWSGARLSYIESAKQDVREDDLEGLLPLYNVPEDRWAEYYSAAERSREHGWWERYGREMPDYVALFVGLEQGASLLQTYEPSVIPGLLQTPEYAEEVLRRTVWPRTDQEISRLVDLRVQRQDVLTRKNQPLQYAVVLDESVLRRVAKDAAAMAKQLDHIAELSELPNVSIRIIPLERGVQSYSPTGFVIFEFAWETDPMVAYVELRDQAVYLEERQDIKGYILAFHNLWQLAFDEDQSRSLARATSREYTKT